MLASVLPRLSNLPLFTLYILCNTFYQYISETSTNVIIKARMKTSRTRLRIIFDCRAMVEVLANDNTLTSSRISLLVKSAVELLLPCPTLHGLHGVRPSGVVQLAICLWLGHW